MEASIPNHWLKLLLFPEKHGETDDGCVDQKAADNRHDHGRDLDGAAVGEDSRKGYLR